MKKLMSIILSSILVGTMACSFIGCAENADVIETEVPIPEYSAINQEFDDYRVAYSQYREENTDDISKLSDGYTTDEIPCSVHYVEADNGTYKMATLEASREIDGGEVTVTDSYFNLSDTEMFITRWYVNSSGVYIIKKYVVSNDILYSINDDTYEVVQEERPDSYDFYLSFDEITSIYGAN